MSLLRGLYAITDSDLIPASHFVETVEQAIQGGAMVIQYRDKTQDTQKRLAQAQALQQLCHQYHIPLLINDDIALAQQVGAAGVHLGEEDKELTLARAILGAQSIIGISCYNQLSLAQQAVKEGANYVAFGSFFTSATKPEAVVAPIELLQQARQQVACPLVAIGGITPDNGNQLIAAGAHNLAVIHGIFGQTGVTAAARRYALLFKC